MTRASLLENKGLLSVLDDNLSVSIYDYINNSDIKDKNSLIESLKSSEKYYFDETSELIRLTYKAKRKIIVFRDVPKEKQSEEEMRKFFEMSPKNYNSLIIKIDYVNELFFIYFNDEETTLEVFKWIEHMRENEKNIPFTFSAFVKVENIKRDLMNLQEEDLEANSKLILNTKDYKPRKLSAREEVKQKQINQTYSKFDACDPYINGNNKKHSVYSKNKFDLDNTESLGYSSNNRQYEKRNKAYSIHENYYQPLKTQVPLNKDYKLEENNIEFKYSTTDIIRTFMNMNLLKKFEIPDDLKENSIPEVINENSKGNLIHFQAKKQHLELRERAHTFHEKPRKSSYYHNEYRGSKFSNYKY